MVPPERRRSENTKLRESIAELERVGNDYADFMLLDAVAEVDMEKIIGGFTLPPKAEEAFMEWGAPAPQLIAAINLDVKFDRASEQCQVTRGGAVFDNHFGLAFGETQQVPGENAPYHPLDLFTHDLRGVLKMRRIGLSPTSHVHAFFNQCGINIPMAPLQTSWEDLVPTLESAEQGVITAEKSAIISPVHELLVTEQIVEVSSPDTIVEKSETIESGWVKEISIQLIDYEELVASALEAVLRTNSPFEPAKFKGIYRNTGIRKMTSPMRRTPFLANRPDKKPVESELLPADRNLASYVALITQALQAAGF